MRFRPKYVRLVHGYEASFVATRWRNQYQKENGWLNTYRGSAEETYNALVSLGDCTSQSKIAEVMGSTSWGLHCESCDQACDLAVSIGDNDDPKVYCQECIEEALCLIKEPLNP